MPEEVEDRKPDVPSAPAEAKAGAPLTTAKPQPTDKWAVRRAELKRQKRRAHRRRIHASNTPG